MKICYSVQFNSIHFQSPDLTIGGNHPRLIYDNYHQYFAFSMSLQQKYEYVHIKSPKTNKFKSFHFLEKRDISALATESYRFWDISQKFDNNIAVDIFSDMEENSYWLFILIKSSKALK